MNKIKDFVKTNQKYFLLIFFPLAIFIVIATFVWRKELIGIDQWVSGFIHQIFNENWKEFFLFVTDLGGVTSLLAISVISILVFKKKKYPMCIWMNLILISLSNIILKNIFQRERPNENMLIEETGFSFPSGHSMTSMAFYGYLIYLAYQKIENKFLKVSICIVVTLIIFLIGISRIYLGVHYASDVISGFCFSFIYLIIFIKISNYITDK